MKLVFGSATCAVVARSRRVSEGFGGNSARPRLRGGDRVPRNFNATGSLFASSIHNANLNMCLPLWVRFLRSFRRSLQTTMVGVAWPYEGMNTG